MNVIRYKPYVHASPAGYFPSMTDDSNGNYVRLEDYQYLMGVVKNLRRKLEKKRRRNKKFLPFHAQRSF